MFHVKLFGSIGGVPADGFLLAMASQLFRALPGALAYVVPRLGSNAGGGGGGYNFPTPVYYQPPKTDDPSILAAQNAAAASQQALRGRTATLLVDKASSGDLLPSPLASGGAKLLGG